MDVRRQASMVSSSVASSTVAAVDKPDTTAQHPVCFFHSISISLTSFVFMTQRVPLDRSYDVLQDAATVRAVDVEQLDLHQRKSGFD